MIRIAMTGVMVDDQKKALDFYTNVLGFIKKTDIPIHEDVSWLTVVSPADPDGVEMLLEPDGNPAIQINGEPAAQVFKRTLYEAGIPYTTLQTDDIHADFTRMSQNGAKFVMEPTELDGAPGVIIAMFDDTCGNLIQLHQTS
jgi:predicted enzyme related to lactoylglutathione lyase